MQFYMAPVTDYVVVCLLWAAGVVE